MCVSTLTIESEKLPWVEVPVTPHLTFVLHPLKFLRLPSLEVELRLSAEGVQDTEHAPSRPATRENTGNIIKQWTQDDSIT